MQKSLQGSLRKNIKVAMRIAYNGGAFFGFQNQNDVQSVANALECVFRSVGIFSKIVASGRTDKGVHASAQVISLEIPYFWRDLERLRQHLNTKLTPNIYIKRIWEVGKNFHARFSAKRRGYCYVLSKHASPLFAPFSLYYVLKNPNLIQEALKLIVGTHNFEAFMKQGSDEKSSVRIIFRAELREFKNFWILSFWGNGFLRSQVRLMVGFLLEIDKGNLTLEDLKEQLLGKWHYRIPISPNGLFLSRVDY
ncbi:tRNA pseudouridine(38-40) synthase TruA [Helicobacter sp. MIT 11-5569]|uniref:tRNA pseudouridine(38-40) synthase TruA n=1 Tax=Helicobacter sp. MIT 11-5569 TaxID=1548151 RepID=UPI00068BA4BA|nr:tRNA pseudouridine(38-40) synthase TruA [Helicobacter sp. MIT 11-5569]TLD84056.1 tRNA pseudouridine(38-40) synthase TruA [Helicobacter sp. MIT 11-5569]